MTTGTYSESEDWQAAATNEFGANASVVDWQDLKAEFAGDQTGLISMLDSVGLDKGRGVAVTNGGNQIWSGSRGYFFARHEGVVPGGWAVHDQMFNSYISLGSWPGTRKLLVTIPPVTDSDGRYATATIVSAQLNGAPLDTAAPEIVVEAGQTITGTVTTRTMHNYNSGAVVPYGYHYSWDARSGSKVTISSDLSNGPQTWNTSLNLTAPSKPGTYWLAFASNAEFNLNQVFSSTNWKVGSVHWNDGNDIFDLSDNAFESAWSAGYVQVSNYEFQPSSNRLSAEHIGCAPIKIVVTKTPDAGNPIANEGSVPVGNSKIILFTHGWNTTQEAFIFPDDDDPTDADGDGNDGISDWEDLDGALRAKAPSDWTVYGYPWTQDSCPLTEGSAIWNILYSDDPSLFDYAIAATLNLTLKQDPQCARSNAMDHGKKLADELWAKGYRDFHLIAHSAGSWLISEAFKRLSSLSSNSGEQIYVQLTFLDAYTPNGELGVSEFGVNSDGAKPDYVDVEHFLDDRSYLPSLGSLWSHAFSGILNNTRANLRHGYNFNVATLLPPIPSNPVDDHGWPVRWYALTASPEHDSVSPGYGFDNSISQLGTRPNFPDFTAEGERINLTEGGWQATTSSSSITRAEPQEKKYGGPYFAILQTLGNIVPDPMTGKIVATTASPAAVVARVELDEPANEISIDFEFTGVAGGEGVLLVEWDGIPLGQVDERFNRSNTTSRAFALPTTAQPGSHILGIRIDPHGLNETEVTIGALTFNLTTQDSDKDGSSDEAEALAGTDPFDSSDFLRIDSFSVGATQATVGWLGKQNVTYTVKSSLNLVDWFVHGDVAVSAEGPQSFNPPTGGTPTRFYRVDVIPSKQ